MRMDHEVDKVKRARLLYKAGYLVAGLFLSWGLLWSYLGMNASTSPNESTGEVYSLKFHGTTVYVDFIEMAFIYMLPIAGFTGFLVLALLEKKLGVSLNDDQRYKS